MNDFWLIFLSLDIVERGKNYCGQLRAGCLQTFWICQHWCYCIQHHCHLQRLHFKAELTQTTSNFLFIFLHTENGCNLHLKKLLTTKTHVAVWAKFKTEPFLTTSVTEIFDSIKRNLWKIQSLTSFACRSQWSQLNGARHFCQTLRRDTPPFHQSKRLLCTMLHFDKFLSGMIIRFFSKQTRSIEFSHSFNLSFNRLYDEISEIILDKNL